MKTAGILALMMLLGFVPRQNSLEFGAASIRPSNTYAAESVSAPGRKDEPSPAVQDTGAPSIFTALREQLGLQLVSQKVSMEYLVIDAVEKPSG
jgi:hypothetical protein